MNETIRLIKQDFRLAMNGVASARMRDGGLKYKINFGVEIPRLLDIAKGYAQDFSLAQTLWNENIRESKILACLLMPTADFTPDFAEVWVDAIPNIEIARLYVMFLLARLPYAIDLSFRWIATDGKWRQVCGLLLVARLIMQGVEFNERAVAELKDQAQAVVSSADAHIAQAAHTVLSRL